MMADMHTHSVNSHDSVCEIEDMCLMQIKRGTNIFAVTDHCDVFSYKDYDIYTPIRNSADTVRTLNEKYGEKCLILSGVEISEGFWYNREYEKIHNLLPYDVILGSVHCVKYKDLEMPYSGIDFSKLTNKHIYSYMDCYFNDMLEILAAYQNRRTCSITIGDTVIAADFTTAAGKILSYSAGHIHEDRTSFSEEANIWQIFSGMGSGCGNIVSATENVIYKYFVDFNHWFTGKDEKLISPAK